MHSEFMKVEFMNVRMMNPCRCEIAGKPSRITSSSITPADPGRIVRKGMWQIFFFFAKNRALAGFPAIAMVACKKIASLIGLDYFTTER